MDGWSEEAFELWTQAWATLYDDETESCSLIYDIHDTYYLVAIIDDEYTDCELFTTIVEEMVQKANEWRCLQLQNRHRNRKILSLCMER